MLRNEVQLFSTTTPVFDWNLTARADVIVNQGGTSSSKTVSILQVLIVLALTESSQIITVVGQDIPNLKAGALRDFEGIMFDPGNSCASFLSDYNKSDRIFRFLNGSMIEFKSYDNPQDAKSGKRDYLFLNEADGIEFVIYEELAVRTRKQIYIDYNPTAPFWVHENLIGRPGVQLFISNYRHNPYLDQKTIRKIERYKETDQNRWQVYGLGKTGVVRGVIFDNCYRCESFPVHSKKVAFGLDFGYSEDPTALVMMGVYQGDLYGQQLIFEPGLTNPDIARRLRELGIPEDAEIFADSAEPKSIAEIQSFGFNVIAADKGADSVRFGIKLLKGFSLYITADSEGWWSEQRRYKWKEKDGKPLPIPIDKYNHCWDAARYYSIMKLTPEQYDGGYGYRR